MAVYKNTVKNHPFHPPIVLLALALYFITPLVFLTAYLAQNIFIFRLGVMASIAGVFTALIVTLPGFVDLVSPSDREPRREPALSSVIMHLLLSLMAVVVFTASVVYTLPDWGAANPQALLPFLITLVGLAVKLGAFHFGRKILHSQVEGVEVPLAGGIAANSDFAPPTRRTA